MIFMYLCKNKNNEMKDTLGNRIKEYELQTKSRMLFFWGKETKLKSLVN